MTETNGLIPENHQQIAKVGFPLGVILNPSREIAVVAGETCTLSVTIANEGNQSAIIDLIIEETSGLVRQWCISPHTSIALEPQQSREVIFKFQIPFDARSGLYAYTLKVDSPRQYRDALPIFYSGKIRVLPPVEQIREAKDPIFTIQPSSLSDAPIIVQGGELIPLQVIVKNRSDQVDQFYLTCSDLAPDWFKVIYPEKVIEEGIITSAEGLELNPQQTGEIQLNITIPVNTLAGPYSPTVSLLSANRGESMVLLGLIHIQVEAVYQLDVDFITQVGTVSDALGWFKIRLQNSGNTPREVNLKIIDSDGEHLCKYILERENVKLLSQEKTVVDLQVELPPAWRRPFSGRIFNFIVEIEDNFDLPLTVSQFPGTLFWKPRPWWHLFILILSVLALLAGVIGLVWWLLTRPKPQPKIVQFTPQSTVYQAINNEVIRLNWEITDPQQIATINLVGLSSDGQVISQPITYDFTQGIPEILRDFCSQEDTLLCVNVPTDGFKAGDYRFQIAITSKRKTDRDLPPLNSDLISILPIPEPTLESFTAGNPSYEEGVSGGVKLNWKINNFHQLKELCLSVHSTNPQQKVKVNILGKGIKCAGKGRQQATGSRQKENTKTSNSDSLEYILAYEFAPANSIPPQLQSYCQVNQVQLICYDVPTAVKQTGKYVFQLTLISQYIPPHSLIVKQTEPIEIKPRPIPVEIVQFDLNGKPAPPTYRVNLQKQTSIAFTWTVKGDKTLKVELLPAPGNVSPSGQLVYELSAEPKTKTITLQAIDNRGQKQSRSVIVIVETFLPPPPSSELEQQGEGESTQPEPLAPVELPPRFR